MSPETGLVGKIWGLSSPALGALNSFVSYIGRQAEGEGEGDGAGIEDTTSASEDGEADARLMAIRDEVYAALGASTHSMRFMLHWASRDGEGAAAQRKMLWAWVGWWRQRVTKRKVMVQITLLRNETVLRRYVIKWFEYCESVSDRSTPLPQRSTPSPPRTTSSQMPLPQTPSSSRKKFARPTRPATALQITSREAVEKAGIEEDSTSSPSPPPRKVKDMRPSALTSGDYRVDTVSRDQEDVFQQKKSLKSISAQPSVGLASPPTSLATIANEPCPNSPKAGPLRSDLRDSLKKIRAGRTPPISPIPTPPRIHISPPSLSSAISNQESVLFGPHTIQADADWLEDLGDAGSAHVSDRISKDMSEKFDGLDNELCNPSTSQNIDAYSVEVPLVTTMCTSGDNSTLIQVLKDAIAAGVPVYNRGDYQECYTIYSSAALAVLKMSDDDQVKTMLEGALQKAKECDMQARGYRSTAAAWALRSTFDFIIHNSRIGTEKQNVSSRSSRPSDSDDDDVPMFSGRTSEYCDSSDHSSSRNIGALLDACNDGTTSLNRELMACTVSQSQSRCPNSNPFAFDGATQGPSWRGEHQSLRRMDGAEPDAPDVERIGQEARQVGRIGHETSDMIDDDVARTRKQIVGKRNERSEEHNREKYPEACKLSWRWQDKSCARIVDLATPDPPEEILEELIKNVSTIRQRVELVESAAHTTKQEGHVERIEEIERSRMDGVSARILQEELEDSCHGGSGSNDVSANCIPLPPISESPVSSLSKDSEEVRIDEAWQLLEEEDEGDKASVSVTQIEDLGTTRSRTLSPPRSYGSLNTFTAECVDSIWYEHEFKLLVRVMHGFKYFVYTRRLSSMIRRSREERSRRSYLRCWYDWAEQQRFHVRTVHFVLTKREKKKWRQCLNSWSLWALKQRAHAFRTIKSLLCFLLAWSSLIREEKDILEQNLILQMEKSKISRLTMIFHIWLQFAQFSRTNKVSMMKPSFDVDGLTLSSPRELLRRTHGDFLSAQDLQKTLQIKFIQTMLGYRVSESTACQLLEHAGGSTSHALRTAQEAQKLGMAVHHYSQVCKFVNFKTWARDANCSKILRQILDKVQQRSTLQGLFRVFKVWDAWMKLRVEKWHVQLSIQKQAWHMKINAHFQLWLDIISFKRRWDRVALRLSTLWQTRLHAVIVHEWRNFTQVSLCRSQIYVIIRSGFNNGLIGRFMSAWSHWTDVAMKARRQWKDKVCTRIIREWFHKTKQHKVCRVSKMLNYYEEEIRPLISPFVAKRLQSATELLAETNGDTNVAPDRAMRRAQKVIAMAHFVGNLLSRTFEALKDFIYEWKAWKLLISRVELLPAKRCFVRWASADLLLKMQRCKQFLVAASVASHLVHVFFAAWRSEALISRFKLLPARHCFVCWTSTYLQQKMHRCKQFLVAASVASHLVHAFFAAWRCVCNYNLGLVESAKYLAIKRKVSNFHRWKQATAFKVKHKELFKRLVHVSAQFTRGHASHVLRAWSYVANRVRTAQLILAREYKNEAEYTDEHTSYAHSHMPYGRHRLHVWQREWFVTYRARKRFITSATTVALIRVRRLCARAVDAWYEEARCAQYITLIALEKIKRLRKCEGLCKEIINSWRLLTWTKRCRSVQLQLALMGTREKLCRKVLEHWWLLNSTKRCRSVQLQLTLSEARKKLCRNVLEHWWRLTSTMREFFRLLPLARQNMQLSTCFERWAEGLFLSTNWSLALEEEVAPLARAVDIKSIWRRWRDYAQDSVQLNEHKRRMNKKSTKFLRKAHDCILLAVLADWYRFTVAFRGVQMRTQQILLRNVLGAIADTYRVKSQAKKMAIKVGESAFREWQTGLALSSPLKCSSFSSIESQMSVSSLVSNYDAVLEDNGQEVLDRFRENGGSADNCTHTRTHASYTPLAHSRRKEEYTDSGQEIPFAGLNLCARGPDSVDEAFQSPRDEIQSNSEPECCLHYRAQGASEDQSCAISTDGCGEYSTSHSPKYLHCTPTSTTEWTRAEGWAKKNAEAILASKSALLGPHSATWHPGSKNVRPTAELLKNTRSRSSSPHHHYHQDSGTRLKIEHVYLKALRQKIEELEEGEDMDDEKAQATATFACSEALHDIGSLLAQKCAAIAVLQDEESLFDESESRASSHSPVRPSTICTTGSNTFCPLELSAWKKRNSILATSLHFDSPPGSPPSTRPRGPTCRSTGGMRPPPQTPIPSTSLSGISTSSQLEAEEEKERKRQEREEAAAAAAQRERAQAADDMLF